MLVEYMACIYSVEVKEKWSGKVDRIVHPIVFSIEVKEVDNIMWITS